MLLVHLIVLVGLSCAERNKPTDVLARLKSKAPDCDLKSLVRDEPNWKLLEEDLTNYCSASPKELTKNSVVLCKALYYELKASCPLTGDARPVPAKYDLKKTADKICSSKNVVLTTEWIWPKLKLDNNPSELTKENFCAKLAEPEETRRLVQFFYRIAPNIRKAALANAEPAKNATGQIAETAKKVVGEVQEVAAKVGEKVSDAGQAVKGKAEQLVNATKGELNGTLDKLLGKGNELVQGALDAGRSLVNQTKGLIDAGRNKLNETVTEVKDAAASVLNKTGQFDSSSLSIILLILRLI